MRLIKSPAETQQDHVDAAFTCSQAIERVNAMQLEESSMVADIADAIARRVHGEAVKEIPAKDRQRCWFAAVQAVRSQHQHWTDEALHEAVETLEFWMEHEGGGAYRHLTPAHRRALAVQQAAVVLVAYRRVIEGTKAMAAGEYLRIVEGQ